MTITLKEIEGRRRAFLDQYVPYKLIRYDLFDYGIFNHLTYCRRPQQEPETVNDCLIMADTETSKKTEVYKTIVRKQGGQIVSRQDVHENHVVAWTISVRQYGRNIVTLYGSRPSEFCECVGRMLAALSGDKTVIYFHNLSYDYVFLRKFLYMAFGFPCRQLNTKPHYPILIEFENGLILKDSLIIAQRSLEKWAEDLDVEHKKAVGFWDYSKVRDQGGTFTPEELEYIEHDTLAGVECLDRLRETLAKKVYCMPYTATGIPREDVKKIGLHNKGNSAFKRHVMDFELYLMSEDVYHGGFTHANRHELGYVQKRADPLDFASSYPFQCLAKKMPMTGFSPLSNKPPAFILEYADRYAFMFKLCMLRPRLKDPSWPMPVLQFSKAKKAVNAVIDNGRILEAAYIEICLTEIDLKLVMEQYDHDGAVCTHVHASEKGYLPRWLTDYIYQLFEEKTKLKGGDPVLYALAKSKLNSVYGMMVQKCIRPEIVEDFETGEYTNAEQDPAAEYEKFCKSRKQVLLYQWGIWVTAYAMECLFRLGKCVSGTWYYSDTDSIYASGWDQKKVAEYNESVKAELLANGYGPVIHAGREWWLGVAEPDAGYSEFVTLGAKRYAGRSDKDGQLHITVAGVPKKGATCLKNDLKNFRRGFIFDGETTGKLMHTYLYKEGITVDERGNETGDSIDLTPCDYLLDQAGIERMTWEDLETEELEITYFESEDFDL